jgi:putative transposase
MPVFGLVTDLLRPRRLLLAENVLLRQQLLVSIDTVELIRRMARENRLWGAERIRGELLKLGIRVAKRTIQKYLRTGGRPRSTGQRWATFLENHSKNIWACDFVQTYDIWFRPIFAFFIINVGTREVVHVSVTRAPTQQWTAQQLRNSTLFGKGPRFIIRDRDCKFGAEFDRAASAIGTRVIRTAVRTPDMNATCERFLGSVRRECLDHLIVLSERHLLAVLAGYVSYFNHARPHQGLNQSSPGGTRGAMLAGEVIAFPVLGGLHHDYRRAA